MAEETNREIMTMKELEMHLSREKYIIVSFNPQGINDNAKEDLSKILNTTKVVVLAKIEDEGVRIVLKVNGKDIENKIVSVSDFCTTYTL